MKPTAKSLILDLLMASEGHLMPARLLIDACRLFNITENSVRVALVRLSTAGLVEAAARGTYRLGEGAVTLAREVANWRHAESRVRDWSGAYVAVHTGAANRSDRTAVRHRARALQIMGFAELERGLFVRPDNIDASVEAVRGRLRAVGLEPSIQVFLVSSLSAELESRARRLWDGAALTAGYRRMHQQLDRWLERSPDLEADVAARESFLLGKRAIRQIVFDPLLPAPFVDVSARAAFIDATCRFDTAGHRIWRRFFDFSSIDRPAPLVTTS